MVNNKDYSKDLLHVLHAEQRASHCISDQATSSIAKKCKLPRAQIEAVTAFYSFFSRQPRGRFDVLFSNCTSCGDAALMQRLCTLLNIKLGETRNDGVVSVTETSCIGMCDHGVSVLINDQPIHSLDSARIEAMAQLIDAETPLKYRR